jgi:hypothetical protein
VTGAGPVSSKAKARAGIPGRRDSAGKDGAWNYLENP